MFIWYILEEIKGRTLRQNHPKKKHEKLFNTCNRDAVVSREWHWGKSITSSLDKYKSSQPEAVYCNEELQPAHGLKIISHFKVSILQFLQRTHFIIVTDSFNICNTVIIKLHSQFKFLIHWIEKEYAFKNWAMNYNCCKTKGCVCVCVKPLQPIFPL